MQLTQTGKMKNKRNVVLVGFMGSGKTTVGLRLSYRLRKTVTDTDKWIEKRQGCTIKEIFATRGEDAFRQMETAALEEISRKAINEIVSVGGGTPIREENRVLLRKIGTVVYLKISPDAVYERLKNDTVRPLLQGENPKEKIRELLAQREEYYAAAADVIVEVDNKNMEDVLQEILEKLEALV